MSEPQLDDHLRALGDRGLDADPSAALARLRDRLEDDLPQHRSARRTGGRSRLLVAAFTALGTAATFTATAAVALTAATGSPVPGFARGDTTNVFPDAGTSRVTDARAADPDGGPAWSVRIGRTADGLVCVGTGQVTADGTFGIRGLDDRFREVAPFGNDPCGPAPRSGRPLVQLRGFSGQGTRSPTGATSVVYGSGGPGLRTVHIATAAGKPQVVPVAESGAFVLAVPGFPEGAAPSVVLEWDDGTERTVELGRNASLPDPAGRVGWSAWTAYRGPQGCVVVSILRVQQSGGARVCGPLSGRQATLVKVRPMHGVGERLALLVRRDGGDRVAVTRDGRNVPLVTVRMAGRVRNGTARVLERVDGKRRMVERTVRTSGPGPTASLAILPPGTRTEDLRITARRHDRGRTLLGTAAPSTLPTEGR